MIMLPDWMTRTDNFTPPAGSSLFAVKTIQSLGRAMSHVRAQTGHEKGHYLPALFKLIVLVIIILLLSLTHSRLLLLAVAAPYLLYLSTWPAGDIAFILKSAMAASLLALILFLPAMLMNPAGAANNWMVIAKVFICVVLLNIFNHTTQWNHITLALRRVHVPGIFVFTLDITLKYIVLLGQLINELLTSLQLRSVGKNNRKYQSIGGVMGVTFVRSAEMSQQMYEAMQCRGFTDDYRGL